MATASAGLQPIAPGQIGLRGELDHHTVVQLLAHSHELFAAAHEGRVTLDLSAVSYSDSTGVALLVEWLKMARHRQIQLMLSNLPTQMRALIQVSGLAELLSI